jgi:hypothetical protein
MFEYFGEGRVFMWMGLEGVSKSWVKERYLGQKDNFQSRVCSSYVTCENREVFDGIVF